MSRNKILRLIISFGIRSVDAEMYIFLATNGPKKGGELYKELNLNKQQVYRSLKRLQKLGLVKTSLKRPALFTALTIEDSLNSFMETKLVEAEFIKEKKAKLLSRWQSMIKNGSEP